MLGKLQRDEKGFTIIEVLIVLAIAGLIMLIVFLAVPALQRNQRNNARNNEASRVATAINECLSNRNGQAASCDTAAEISITPATDFQQFTAVNTVGSNGTPGTTAPTSSTTAVGVWFGRKCNTEGSGADTTAGGLTGNVRTFAVVYTLEPDIGRCINN